VLLRIILFHAKFTNGTEQKGVEEQKSVPSIKKRPRALGYFTNPDINLKNTGTTEQIGYNALISTNYVFHTAKSDWNKKI
jgi:hypothetical protein